MKVIYENKDYVIIIKPRGVLSQMDASGEEGLVQILARELSGQIYPVHRLDRPVGGVMLYARTKDAAARLSEADAFDKTYLAVCGGAFPDIPTAGEMEDYLYKDGAKGKSFVVKKERRGAKLARLAYELLGQTKTESGEDLFLMRIRLFTGRTHQIRVQLSSRGMPIAGDGKYGSRLKGQFISLWSYSIRMKDGRVFTLPPEKDAYFDAFAPLIAELK